MDLFVHLGSFRVSVWMQQL